MMITTIAFRAILILAILYALIVAALWLMQSRLIYPAPQKVDALPHGYSEIAVPTHDGLSLRAFYRPAAQGMPTAIFFHGNGGSLAGSVCASEALAQAGIGQLLLAYRGYGGNAGSPSETGLYKDGDAAMKWLFDQGITADRIVMIGNSIGGGVASEMAVLYQPAGLILIAPFTSLPDVVSEKLRWLPVRYLIEGHYANAEKLAGFTRPVLIQHGDADTLIPDSHGQALAQLIPGSTFQSFAGAGHNFACSASSQEARRDWILAMDSGIVTEG